MARLYSLGAFEILLWKLLAGDLMDWEKDLICKFLLQVHLHQVVFWLHHHASFPFPSHNFIQIGKFSSGVHVAKLSLTWCITLENTYCN